MPDWQPRKPSILILANGDAIDACLITSVRVLYRAISVRLDEPNGYTVLVGCGSNTFDVDFRDVDEANAERDRVIAAWRAATDEAKPALDADGIEDVASTWALERWDTWALSLLGKSGDIQGHGRQNLQERAKDAAVALERWDSQGLWRQVLRTEIAQKCTTVDIEGFRRTHEVLAADLTKLADDRDIARKRYCAIASDNATNPTWDAQYYAERHGWHYLYT